MITILSQLYIENLAVISRAEITFTAGLNVFTGETGAGKTIIINAINAVMGERISKDIIRTGEKRALVRALFTDISAAVSEAIEDAGYVSEPDGTLMISREIFEDSRTVCRINGVVTTVSVLKRISPLLISVHGQQDNRDLLSVSKHIEYIDRFAGNNDILQEYRNYYRKMLDARDELESLTISESEKARMCDLLDYQINELERAELVIGEDTLLSDRRRLIKNSEHICEALSEAYMIISGDRDTSFGICEQMEELSAQLSNAGEYLPSVKQLSVKISDMMYDIRDISEDIKTALESVDYNSGELSDIEERLSLIASLKRKYGSTIEDILDYYSDACKKREAISRSEERISQLEIEIEELLDRTRSIAQRLSVSRAEAGEAFTALVRNELEFLDMPSVRLELSQQSRDLSENGADSISFLISTNPGEEPRPLAKIASGGELSRIMLAIKNVLADCYTVETMIFDEIDTGVSGRAAQKIGRKLHQAASGKQVICVTHSAQVAAMADSHMLIVKRVENTRTFTVIETLDRNSRIKELARISGGETITAVSLENAEELLRLSQQMI